ncbi:hypothetical protein BXT86_02735, partial [candidate division WOR-3 bacterium 4484_100]
LDIDTVANLEHMGKKSAQNLISAIEQSKQREFVRVLYGLGIPNIGLNGSHLLVNEFKTIENIINAKLEDFVKINGIGKVVAKSIINYFKNKKNRDLIKNLKKIGLKFEIKKSLQKRTSLIGKRFVFTGELKSMTRTEAQNLVREYGGQPSSTVSKNTDYVVMGKNPGSKFEKAKKLNIRIINEEQFLRLIKRGKL